MTAYRRFLTITAKSLNVEIDALSPTQFDEKSRVSESLIISSIFFDLLKMLDKLDSAGAADERRQYHKLFLRFTKGMPFQHFAAENIRKHLVYSKSLRNKAEFWATYRSIVGRSFCLVATWAFDSDCAPEVERLRRFREEVLEPRRAGRAFTRWYYRNGHRVAEVLARVPGGQAATKRALREISRFF